MIHPVILDAAAEPESLKKLFRKRLMTGGAVVRLAPSLTASELQLLIDRFSLGLEPYGVQSLVLEEIAKDPRTTEAQRQQLAALNLPAIQRALSQNPN